jgi:hypothetical protein
MNVSKAAICVCVAGVLAGCSSDDEPQVTSGVRDGGAESAASGGGAGTGGGAGSGGNGGSAASGGSGGSSGGTLNCEGAFGLPRLLLDAGTQHLASPTLPGDELELFYVTYDPDGTNRRIRRSTRASRTETFPLGSEVAELNALCTDPAERAAIDITADALRAYVSCADTALGRMLLAQRTSKTAPFLAVGSVSTEIGGSAAVNATELAVYSTGASAGTTTPLVATRGSTAEPFGTPAPVPGLTGIDLVAPDPSPDELWLFGGFQGRQLSVAHRNTTSEPFGAPVDITVPLFASGAPHVSVDCRRVYFIAIETADAGSRWGIYVIER